MNIITNNVPRPLVSLSELPVKDAKDFGYIKENDAFTPRLVQYKGAWYDTHDSMRTSEVLNDPFYQWHGYISDTFFSGVLFRFVNDDDVICGRYYA